MGEHDVSEEGEEDLRDSTESAQEHLETTVARHQRRPGGRAIYKQEDQQLHVLVVLFSDSEFHSQANICLTNLQEVQTTSDKYTKKLQYTKI